MPDKARISYAEWRVAHPWGDTPVGLICRAAVIVAATWFFAIAGNSRMIELSVWAAACVYGGGLVLFLLGFRLLPWLSSRAGRSGRRISRRADLSVLLPAAALMLATSFAVFVPNWGALGLVLAVCGTVYAAVAILFVLRATPAGR
jgi:hypothetical protein